MACSTTHKAECDRCDMVEITATAGEVPTGWINLQTPGPNFGANFCKAYLLCIVCKNALLDFLRPLPAEGRK